MVAETYTGGIMARVVLIHGVGRQSSCAQAELGEWIPSLVKGVLLSRHPSAGKVGAELAASVASAVSVVQMAFYGDLFLSDTVQGYAPTDSAETKSIAEELAVVLLQSAAHRDEPRLKAQARIILSQIDSNPEDTQGAGAMVRGAMARLDGDRWLAQRIFGLAQHAKPDLMQVARYLTDVDTRSQIQNRLNEQITEDTCLIIGHSLGSIVAWETCHTNKRHLPMLLTIGSPLGLDSVVYPRLRPLPPMFPPSVQRWVNVAHPDDVVAVEPRLAPLFPSEEGREVEDHNPRSAGNHHAATTYLEQAQVGYSVAEVLIP